MKVRKLSTTVEFKCSNHMRTAQLSLSEMGMDEIFCVSLLAPGWRDSNIILTDKMAKNSNGFTISNEIVNLRWFDMPGEIKQDGTISMEVELTYTSKKLDREEKLELIGID